jgi:signal transduction histidine kinase
MTARLLVHLILVQFLVIIFEWAIMIVFGPSLGQGAFGYNMDDLFASQRARDDVIQSIARAPDNSLFIEPAERLRAEQLRTPGLRFAVFQSLKQAPLPGSSAELTAGLQAVSSVEAWGMEFKLPGDPPGTRGSLWRWRTPHGPLFIALSGYSFAWTDPIYRLVNDVEALGVRLVPLLVVSGLVAWLVVHRAFAPVRAAVAAAEKVDLDTLGQDLPSEGAPSEIKPLIGSINAALARLDASAARMRRYTASAAHELRTPLAVLDAHIEDPPGPGYKTRLKRDVARMRIIVDQILASARLTEGQAPRDQIVDLVRVARSIVGDCAPLAHKAGRHIELDANVASVAVRGNRQAIECILANLVDNALRAEPEGGVVIVQIGPTATMTVIDHGPGVCDEDKTNIFEPFWRKDERTPGAGLGLSITKDLVSRHGGHISVEGTPGGGATFGVVFTSR